MSNKSDNKHLLVNTIQGGKHTVEVAFNFEVQKIRWLQKSMGGFNLDFLFKNEMQDEKKETHTKWGVCFLVNLEKNEQYFFL